MTTEVKPTEEQIAARIRKDEHRWAMAQKIAEQGEFASTAANIMLKQLDPLDLPKRELFFGGMSIVVSIGKSMKLKEEQLTAMLHVLYLGIDAAMMEEEKKEERPPQ